MASRNMEIDTKIQEIDLVHRRLSSIPALHLERFQNVDVGDLALATFISMSLTFCLEIVPPPKLNITH